LRRVWNAVLIALDWIFVGLRQSSDEGSLPYYGSGDAARHWATEEGERRPDAPSAELTPETRRARIERIRRADAEREARERWERRS
jgi:hypothetical protein